MDCKRSFIYISLKQPNIARNIWWVYKSLLSSHICKSLNTSQVFAKSIPLQPTSYTSLNLPRMQCRATVNKVNKKHKPSHSLLWVGGGLNGWDGGRDRLGLGGTVWLGESGRSLGDMAPLVNRLSQKKERDRTVTFWKHGTQAEGVVGKKVLFSFSSSYTKLLSLVELCKQKDWYHYYLIRQTTTKM